MQATPEFSRVVNCILSSFDDRTENIDGLTEHIQHKNQAVKNSKSGRKSFPNLRRDFSAILR